MMYRWKVKDNQRLDEFLRTEIPLVVDKSKIVSNSKIRRLIMAGCIKVNGAVCRNPSLILRPHTDLTADIDESKFFYEKKPDDIDFILTSDDVLYEDDYIIVVNKPAFYPSEPTIVKDRGNMHASVVKYLWAKNPSLRNPPYVGIMHRLDRETSGVLLFTKTRSVNPPVHDMFEKHTARKTYRAVCKRNRNAPERKINDTFSVENFIGRISCKSAECKIGLLQESKGGLYSRTDFRIADIKDNLYYIDCSLLTGRTHQIRVHLSLSGYPIVGDELYGGEKGFREYDGRIMLHAYSLKFPHPVTGEEMEVTAPIPQGFGEVSCREIRLLH